MKLLRRRDVMDRLGVTERQLRTLIETGLIKPIRRRHSRAWYRLVDIQRLAT